MSGLVEKEGDLDLANFCNQSLLPMLGVPFRFSVAHAYRLGKTCSDSSSRFCKLDFISEIPRDIVLSHVLKLKGLQNFCGVQVRPALTLLQRQLKHWLDEYWWGTFQRDSMGHFPVAVHTCMMGCHICGILARRRTFSCR